MALDLSHPALAQHAPRLSPYLRLALERAAELALRLHAEALALEHLVRVLLEDEESALHRLVLFAFADPETIAFDVLAIAPGMLVVGSDATVPFSPAAVRALRAARERACAAGAAQVEATEVLLEAERALPEALRAGLGQAGFDPARLSAAERAGAGGGEIELETNLFRHFSPGARRLISRAGRAAFRAREPSLGPARLVLAALESEPELEARSGLSRSRARLVLEGRTLDPTPPEARALVPDEALSAFLAALPEGAQSLAVLELLQREPGSELTLTFERQKVSRALLERAQGAFSDPEEAP